MRLINTSTELFEDFIGADIPPYVILSHCWEEEEVSFQDMVGNYPQCRQKKGYQKIKMTCQLAVQDGHQYAWIDTCCIDKSSSAELTEAVNSMYQWYNDSQICYAFLCDLPSVASVDARFPACRWFTRGWTLHELIAPWKLIFFDQDWQRWGTKYDLSQQLSGITGVHVEILLGSKHLSENSVAQKMPWAAARQTARLEDTAYCLLGIFDVNSE